MRLRETLSAREGAADGPEDGCPRLRHSAGAERSVSPIGPSAADRRRCLQQQGDLNVNRDGGERGREAGNREAGVSASRLR